MYRITTENGRVGHIAGSIADTNDGRVVTTVCGKVQPETDFHDAGDLDACGACDKKFYNLVDDAPDVFATPEEAETGGEELAKEAAAAEEADAEDEEPEEKPRTSRKKS